MKTTIKNIRILLMCVITGGIANAHVQEKRDSVKTAEAEQKSDRNVMLNAASANSGPRNVNIGLPASVGGTTVLENNLPVVYFFWPEMPFKSWRMDAMTNGVRLLDLGQTAINIGDVGFSVGTYDNMGTDQFGGNIRLNSNHFGLLNGTANISGPLTEKGLKFSVGTFINYDPGTYKVNKNGIERYYNDQTQLYKVALTRDYKFDGGAGSISAFYKYATSKSMTAQQYAPYKYHLDGSVSEIDGFKIGGDSYIAGQKFKVRDAGTGKIVEHDALNDYGSGSHTWDLIGKNRLDNGLNINYILRFHTAKSGMYLPIMTGISKQTYTDDKGNQVTGNLQRVMALASKRTPIKSLTSLFESGKKSGKHDWKVGLDQWLYNIKNFTTEGVIYSQTVEADPKRVGKDFYGIAEYHNGTENKTALFLTDKWDLSDVLTLNFGTRFEYQSLRGDFINNKEIVADIPYLSNKRTDIKKDWFNKAFMLSGIYKMTKNFGLLGETTYNEQAGHLENYSAGNEPNLKKSKIPGAGFGVFYNHPLFSLVSKATYIKRDEYRSTVNFTSKQGAVARPTVSYDIETVGWTTDVVATPSKDFNLHFLLTVQAPKYKNYSGTVNFNTGESVDYNFNDNTVTGVSKVLMEIDPAYQWNSVRLWASARYFSKEYANLTNSLFFKGRWETFAGANYSLNKNLDFSATIVNLLNQRGAKGTISGADLYTDEEAAKMEGAILSGTYIRPFTVEFGMKYKF
ncbi:MAG: TonB-dependent receptor [Candidatus Azobacteroides sp.]|nr:TonB-dependent receptor [Candidatus Azobacteroides sp.]